MMLGRGARALVALMVTPLPALLLWLLVVVTLDWRAATRARTVPNPAPLPASYLGMIDVLVYADPYFAGTIWGYWLLPGALVVALLVLWAAGVPVLSKVREAGWPPPRFKTVVGLSFAAGGFLAAPWLYAWVRVLCMAM